MSSELHQILKLGELSVATSWKLEILCLQTSLFVGLLAGFPMAMVKVILDLMVGLSTMMPYMGSSGLRIKYLLAPVRPLWAKKGLSIVYTTLLVLRSSTIMATMVSSRMRNTAKSILRR